ncbi:hypothetical protein [Lysobacter sp. CA199]|uniref:hypothetical protein n=1 Tax=Lysobacter sp. CA199 TaxID=3455608 RepID=UPI003F8D05C7
MSLTLTFRASGEEVIVLKALVDAYERVLHGIDSDLILAAADDADSLRILSDITDYAATRRAQLARRWRKAVRRMNREHRADSLASLGVLGASPPTTMAHGCAALPSAVGTALSSPALASEQREKSQGDITTNANPFFCDPKVQRLQSGGDVTTSDFGGGQ